ncbi:histidine kinase [Streptomyces sp. ME01-18a]|uniref:sensor histidine kinase n=1 Tax=Streptomyces sp. ME01-18a TaxID=3028669 RepID=UPI0029AB3585|nr:histidine kinase [Streptomyces sp. ME01-18a]MDX3433528.1 histidine kinase [Streptomyces sp. ME01-18a]
MKNAAAAAARHWRQVGLVSLTRASGPLPRPTRRNLVFDVLLALAAVVIGVNDALSVGTGTTYVLVEGALQARPEGANTWFGALVPILLATLPLALRRRYPLAVLWVVMGASLLAPDSLARSVFYVFVIATYSAVAYSPYRILAVASVPLALFVISIPQRNPDLPTVPTEYVPGLILLPLAMAAYGMRTWRLRADERQERIAEVERQRAEELRRAAEQERSRIARELHDVVTHNVSMMVIQAGGARKMLDIDPDDTREALLAIEAGGRAAMAELRHAMGLLTINTEDAADRGIAAHLAPQPGLDQLPALVGRARDTGVSVDYTVTGEPRDVAPGVGLTAYRIVQEALTNTVKHAAGARATAVLAYDDDHLRVEITDTGGPPSPSAATGNGHGLIGLRERLTVYGGTLVTGPRPDGGFRVAALIPLETAP